MAMKFLSNISEEWFASCQVGKLPLSLLPEEQFYVSSPQTHLYVLSITYALFK